MGASRLSTGVIKSGLNLWEPKVQLTRFANDQTASDEGTLEGTRLSSSRNGIEDAGGDLDDEVRVDNWAARRLV